MLLSMFSYEQMNKPMVKEQVQTYLSRDFENIIALLFKNLICIETAGKDLYKTFQNKKLTHPSLHSNVYIYSIKDPYS